MSHKKSDLGRCLYKSRFGKSTKNIESNKRKPMKSVLEETDIEKIFSMGDLCDKDYTAIRVINNKDKEGLLDQVTKKLFDQAKEEYAGLLSVPRRPKGAKYMSKEQLLASEKEIFLKWRCQLAKIENDKRVRLTPYELNLDFWRQLWRVIERSDVLIQVVDARNPLLFRNADLEKYVKEVDENKINIVLINKADFLTEKQRQIWAEYFDTLNLRVIFWSAKIAEELRKAEEKLAKENERELAKPYHSESDDDKESSLSEDGEKESGNDEVEDIGSVEEIATEDDIEEEDEEEEDLESFSESDTISENMPDSDDDDEDEVDTDSDCTEPDDVTSSEHEIVEDSADVSGMKMKSNKPRKEKSIKNSWNIIGVDEIVKLLESIKIKTPFEEGKTTVGLVGYPNVGKSSTINAIFGRKKVSVSATPGHTKRFQTLIITDKLTFCDCPGLVMPSIVHSKGHLMVSGILPIDQIRDYIAPINIIAEQFPRTTIELLYGITLPDVREGEEPNRPPTARELLSSYSYMHSMMTSKGNPNLDRAARIILKDYVDGRLLYRHSPPGIDADVFQSAADLPDEKKYKAQPKPSGAKQINNGMINLQIPMFHDSQLSNVKLHAMHHAMMRINMNEMGENDDTESQLDNIKLWRMKGKKGRKEKLRRKYKDLDKHSFVYQ